MKPRIVDLVAAAESAFSLERGSIRRPGRKRPVANARQLVMYMARSDGRTFGQIGIVLGRSKATVRYGVTKCRTLLDLADKTARVLSAMEGRDVQA